MRKHSDFARECTLSRVPASMASLSGTGPPEIRTLFRNFCYRDFTRRKKGADPQNRITRHYSMFISPGILEVPRLRLIKISPAKILMVIKIGTKQESLGGNLTIQDWSISRGTDARPKITTNVVLHFLNQNKNPPEKHTHCEQTLQFNSLNASLAYCSKRKPAKLGSDPKSKLDGLQN